MKMLTKEAVLSAKDLVEEIVEVKEWDGSVKIRALDGLGQDEFESYLIQNPGKNYKVNMKGARTKLLSMSIIDEDGELMFSQEELQGKSGAVLNRLFGVAQRLSGLSDEDIKKTAEDLEDAQAAGSPSV